MTFNSNRTQDMMAEHNLAKFMDRCFYSKLHENDGKPISFRRIEDKAEQKLGIDVYFEAGNKQFCIDEKASLYYSNAMIPTFAFEINSMQKRFTEPIEGWFINDKLKTDYYMLIWPNVRCVQRKPDGLWVRKEIKYLTDNDFTVVEAMLIQKKKIRESLDNLGLNKNRLLSYAEGMRKAHEREAKKESTKSQTIKVNDEIKIMFSGQLAEQPVNVVIRKNVLKELADAVYLISEDGYAVIR